MRFLVKVILPVEATNQAIKDGSLSKKMQAILAELKPEAAYFIEFAGKRTALLFLHIDQPSQIPGIAEPFFLSFNAGVEFHPAMTPEDLAQAGLEELGKKWG